MIIAVKKEEAGKTLLSLLRERGIYLEAPCGGTGTCGRCTVQFLEGAPAVTEREKKYLTREELHRGVRLACMTKPAGVCKIRLPERETENMQILITENRGAEGMQSATVEKQGGEGIQNATVEKRGAEDGQNPQTENRGAACAQKLPAENSKAEVMRRFPSESRVAVVGKESGESGYGIAVDVGTTTLAAVLVRLSDGEQTAYASSVNHQRAYGADVISRIQAANAGMGRQMRAGICADIRQMIRRLLVSAGIAPGKVKKAAVAGNTVMCHLLLGYPCRTLGEAPFTPVSTGAWSGTCQELFGTNELHAQAMVLPGISAFVGADIVAGILYSKMTEQERPSLLLDIGTNGEMALGSRLGLTAASAAAGPVFEGGGISCGVPGIPGAISHITLKRGRDKGAGNALSCSYETIGGKPPIGLCGSGIIDLAAGLAREGIIDENGTLAEPWFTSGIGIDGTDIRFTQRDIREVQLGKAAIRAGIDTLLQGCRETEHKAYREDIRVYLAGGFGYFMDIESAIRIGLLPESFRGNIVLLGNSSLEGARQYLLDGEAAKKAEWIAGHTAEIRLAETEVFQERYVETMQFPAPGGEEI